MSILNFFLHIYRLFFNPTQNKGHLKVSYWLFLKLCPLLTGFNKNEATLYLSLFQLFDILFFNIERNFRGIIAD